MFGKKKERKLEKKKKYYIELLLDGGHKETLCWQLDKETTEEHFNTLVKTLQKKTSKRLWEITIDGENKYVFLRDKVVGLKKGCVGDW